MLVKLILYLVVIISFSWALLTNDSITMQATVDNSFQENANILQKKNNLEETTQRLVLEPLMITGTTLLITNLYYNNCYNPKLLATGLFLTTAYGLSATPIDKQANIFLTFTCLPVWYYLGFQAENYRKDETFSQSISFAAKGLIISLLINNYLYSTNKESIANQNISIIYQSDKVGVSYKF
jgi:hypothetical protein